MITVVDPAEVERDLTAGRLTCPRCPGRLRPWGHARRRRVRDIGTATLTARPRRARCSACRSTQVLLPTALVARRADSTAGIGAALLASAAGSGYRTIAADLNRPLSTVRRWVRAVRGQVAEQMRARAIRCLFLLERDTIARLAPTGTCLGDALNALAAAFAHRSRLPSHVGLWAILAGIAGGQLLPPARAG